MASLDLIVIDSVPRAKLAHALVEQARTDMQICMGEIERAANDLLVKVRNARLASTIRDAVVEASADFAAARDTFLAEYDASLKLFETAREVSGEFDDDDSSQADGGSAHV